MQEEVQVPEMFQFAGEYDPVNQDFNLDLGDIGIINNNLYVTDYAIEEDTLEAPQKYTLQNEVYIPQSPLGPPPTENFAGSLNFSVEISGSEVDKKKYLYSATMNRIYVDMEVNFPIHFDWDVIKQSLMYPKGQDMYIRATVVFSDESQAGKRVERCLQHTHEANNPGNKVTVKNVLRSTRALDTAGVFYCGKVESPDSWFSVVVRFPAPGVHAYQFVCKNSCSSGINRRNIAIIFTLEDERGEVLGRQSVGARVCACPRRDLRRDEDETRTKGKGKRTIEPPPHANLKKVKIEVTDNDDQLVVLPKISIKGIKTVITGLEVMQRMMELSASEASKRNDQASFDEYHSCLATLTTTIENLKKN
ncbi:cellular tumor antigen p53 [Battus philenor]|uniref:cellular tumor antigen p53 n=1 Tax=Battus philenor TaxID=42288 RepID=UPI0035D0E281